MASTGEMESTLFCGPVVAISDDGDGTGDIEKTLFCGPMVVLGAGGGGGPEPPTTVPGLFFAHG